MSDEHVFLDSLKHLAPPGTIARIRFVFRDPLTGKYRDSVWQDKNKNPYQITVRICGICNTDVLNNMIETPIFSQLRAMISGEDISLTSEEMQIFATWCAKTAMTLDLVGREKTPNDTSSIPDDHYRFLHDNIMPPPTTMIFFGKADYTPEIFHRGLRFHLPDVDGRGYFSTMVIGHLWIVVAGFSNLELYDEMWFNFDGHCTVGNRGVLVPIWPPEEQEIDEIADQVILRPREFPPGNKAGALQGSKVDYLRVSDGPSRIIWQETF